MTEEMKQDTAQENPSNVVENKPESPSNDGLLQEVMSKKEKIKTLEAELAKRDANDEERRTKKLEDDGKLKELNAELKLTNEKQAVRLERADKIEAQLKSDIINSITSDDDKREELATKDLDTLRFIQNEIGNKVVDNPQESLGSVRSQTNTKDWTEYEGDEAKRAYEQQYKHIIKR